MFGVGCYIMNVVMRILALLLALPFLLPAQLNTLSPAETANGWILLFDGHSLAGWTAVNGARFRVSHGAIVGDGPVDGALRSDAEFANYILKLEFRAGASCNSGVFLRSAAPDAATETGYEIQIWNTYPQYPTGSLVNHAAATGKGFVPDKWNQFEITVNGDHWLVKLNGRQVLDTRQAGPRTGHIGFQYHPGNKIEFRNIKLKPLG